MIEEVKQYYAKCDACGIYFPGGDTWKSTQSIPFASPHIVEHNIKQFGWIITYTLNETTGCMCKVCNKEAESFMNQKAHQ